MAELLNKIPTNLTEYPNSFKRQGAFPLEAYSVFYTMEAAEAYASSNPVAYVGQTLAVVTANAEDKTIVDSVIFYIIADAAGTLQEVGKATAGDGKTIDLDEESGVLSLHGIEGKSTGTYVPTLVNGVLTWAAPDTSTTDGLQAAMTAVENRATALETTVNGDNGLVGKVNKEIADRQAAGSALETKITEALAEAKKYADDNDSVYDDTALKNRVSQAESDIADHETRIAKVEDFFETADGESLNQALDTLIEIQKEIAEDDEGAAAMLSSINTNTAAIEKLNGDANTAGSVDKKIADAVAPLATTDALSDLASEVGALEAAAATKTELTNGLATKADKTSVYTKTEIDNTFANYHTKTDINSLLAGITGDSTKTIEAVDAALTEHKNAYNTKVDEIAAKDTEQDTAISNAQKQADKGVADAAAAAQAVTQLAQGQVATNKTNIENLTEVVSGAAETSHASRIGVLESFKTNHTGQFNELKAQVEADEVILAKKANAADVYTKTDADGLLATKANAATTYNKTEVDNKVKAVQDAVDGIDLSPYAKEADVNTAVQDINSELAKKAEASNVYTKAEADTKFQTEAQVDARINTLIDAANNTDTIKNVNDLITYVHDNAGDIAELVTNVNTNSGAISNNANAISEHAAAIENLTTCDISTDRLVQGAMTLVLNGGSATVA